MQTLKMLVDFIRMNPIFRVDDQHFTFDESYEVYQCIAATRVPLQSFHMLNDERE